MTDYFTPSVFSKLLYIHLASEIYALWATNGHPDHPPSFCPAGTTESIVYPNRYLPFSTVIPLFFVSFGALIRESCHRYMGKQFTWDTSILKDHKLITTGPYSFVRHPGYTGWVIACVGYTWYLFSPGTFGKECLLGSGFPPSITVKSAAGVAWAACWLITYTDSSVFLIRRSFAEDAMMRKEFGKEWEEWARTVPWNVLPMIL